MPNVNNPYGFQLQRNQAAGASVVTNRFVTVSNTSLVPGDPVVVASGYVKLAGILSTALFGVCMETVVGVAGVRKSVLVIPSLRDYLFAAQNKSAVNLTAGFLGKNFGIAGTTSGKIGSSSTQTTAVLKCVGLKPGSAWGTYAELLFVIQKGYQG